MLIGIQLTGKLVDWLYDNHDENTLCAVCSTSSAAARKVQLCTWCVCLRAVVTL